MSESVRSRRVSEFTGVVLFAVMSLWLVALMSYTPTDPTWFFNNISGNGGVGRLNRFVRKGNPPTLQASCWWLLVSPPANGHQQGACSVSGRDARKRIVRGDLS